MLTEKTSQNRLTIWPWSRWLSQPWTSLADFYDTPANQLEPCQCQRSCPETRPRLRSFTTQVPTSLGALCLPGAR